MDAGKLVAFLGLNTREFDAKLGQQTKAVQSWGKKLAGIMATYLSVREMIRFTAESAKLEGIFQGVSVAFERLNQPNLLENLREATNETVSDLQLMQQAVQANNFKIPLDVLAKGMAFATRRAKETGMAVDYLVESFVRGIGRKSALVIDNLGISVVEMQKEMARTGDFATSVGNIIDREMKKAGSSIKTSADLTAELTAAFKNFQVAIGTGLNPVIDAFKEGLAEALRNTTKILNEETIPAWKKWLMIVSPGLANLNKRQAAAMAAARDEIQMKVENGEITEAILDSEIDRLYGVQKRYEGLTDALKEYGKTLLTTASADAGGSAGGGVLGIIEEITSKLELQKMALPGLKTEKEIKAAYVAIANYEQELKDLADITPDLEKLTAVQSKNALVVVEGLRQVDTSLKVNSEDWASYRANVWETINSLEDLSQVIQSTMVNAIDSIAQSIADLILSTSSFEDFFKSLGLMVANFAVQIGRLVAAIGVALMFIPGMQGLGTNLMLAGAGLMTAGYIGKGLLEKTPGNSSASAVSSGSTYNAGGYSIGTQNIKVQVVGELDGRKLAIASARGNKMLSQMS